MKMGSFLLHQGPRVTKGSISLLWVCLSLGLLLADIKVIEKQHNFADPDQVCTVVCPAPIQNKIRALLGFL